VLCWNTFQLNLFYEKIEEFDDALENDTEEMLLIHGPGLLFKTGSNIEAAVVETTTTTTSGSGSSIQSRRRAFSTSKILFITVPTSH
jgi:hypothetical protein